MPRSNHRTALRELADAAGVAVAYTASGSTHRPPDATLQAVLTALGHSCADERAARLALRQLRRRPWTRQIDPVVVVRRATDDGARRQHTPVHPARVTVSAGVGVTPRLRLTLEDATHRPVSEVRWGGRIDRPDGARRRGSIALPNDLPLGYHQLDIDDGIAQATCTVIVAPERAPSLGAARRWGWMLQLYAVRSSASWGQGEYRDLGVLATWSAEQGADFLLINPVHAVAPDLPIQPSPYSPTSRRFYDPCYLHVPDIDGFAGLSAEELAALTRLPPALQPDSDRIDRDAIWEHKRAALWTLFADRDATGQAALDAFRHDGGVSLWRFATFCGIAEHHGTPFHQWPAALRDPRAAAVASWARDHDQLIAFHCWLQLQCVRQLSGAQHRATAAGMTIGVIHDLAVGVEPGGADVWALPDEFARSMRVGAPPDAFNQQGQEWGQPPPLPGAMRAHGYRTQREILRAALTVGGGLRIDHILGLSRLFWIPHDAGPADGTYVRYPADEQFAVLALEAHRAGAPVIGEDLGTVDDRIRRLMRRRRVAGSAVVYFEMDGAHPRPAARYRRNALASVTTHDLPTATGWWDGSAFDVRTRLGLLMQPVEDATAEVTREREAMEALLVGAGFLDPDGATVRDRVLAMYRLLSATCSRLVAVALWDAVGDPRQPNVPGTVDAYPNWRLPLAAPTPAGPRPVTVEQLDGLAPVRQMVDVVHPRAGTRADDIARAPAGQAYGNRQEP
ncbi:MAG: 4-alpha-glucanotransferase [Actinobacteria bacterium]|nr:4-alpha-glucanotransferase [Actinomycetota bacterium]